MKKVLFILSLFILISSCKAKKEDVSSYNFFLNNNEQLVVYDMSNLFSLQEKDSLSKRLMDYEVMTTNQIAIVTIDSTPKHTTNIRYATDIAIYWGVGNIEKNNGLLILISKHDRQMAIATGLGTENILTDAICKKIIDKAFIPHFKEGDYYEGVNSGLDSIMAKWK